jgi:hypothetical protein
MSIDTAAVYDANGSSLACGSETMEKTEAEAYFDEARKINKNFPPPTRITVDMDG